MRLSGRTKAYLPQPLQKVLDLEKAQPVQQNHINNQLKEGIVDLVYKIPYKGKKSFLYLHLEHQDRSHEHMPLRVYRYRLGMWEDFLHDNPLAKHLPLIITLVCYTGKKKWETSLDIAGSFDPNEKAILDELGSDLIRIDFAQAPEEHRQHENPGLHILQLCFKHSKRPQEIVTKLGNLEPDLQKLHRDSTKQDFLQQIFTYILYQDPTGQTCDRVRVRELLRDKGIREIFMSAAEKLIQLGRDEAKSTLKVLVKQSHQEGRQEGQQEVAIRMLNKGMKIETVVDITHLPLSIIQGLKDNKSNS